MSETVRVTGRIKKINIPKNYDKKQTMSILIDIDPNLETDLDGGFEYSDEIVELNGIYFRTIEKENRDPYENFTANCIGEDDYEYDLTYYNGGCGFTEALEIAMKRHLDGK